MDILYIIGEGVSKCNYFDLRCSLRSLERYGKGIDRIFVAGYCPEWLSEEVIKVPFEQPYTIAANIVEKSINIQETLRYVVDNTDIGDEFAVSMSDHFLVKEVDFDNYPFVCRVTENGTSLPETGKSEYRKFLCGTREFLESKGLSTLFTILHKNMKVTRASVDACSDIMDEVRDNKIPCEVFALLGNWEYTHGISKDNIAYLMDYKAISGSEWWKSSTELTDSFSTNTVIYGIGFYVLLNGRYNKKCKYEL